MKEAFLYQTLENKSVRCDLCGHRCVIPPGKLGVCGVRQNTNGQLFSLVYGAVISQNVDPIEKKPLYHFFPASSAYSVATPGCNFTCEWCQNWQIAQNPQQYALPSIYTYQPDEIVEAAIQNGCRSIAYTYTEPTIFYEFAYDTAKLAKEANIANIFITNGYMSEEMLDHFHPLLDAANVDLKSFRKKTYQRYVGAGLQQVLDSIRKMKALGIWVEVTTLIIPGINDSTEEIQDIAHFISNDLGPDTPWHISRYFPHYKMNKTPGTPVKTLKLAANIGREAGLKYVYVGNVHGGDSNTECPNCNKTLIFRQGYHTEVKGIRDGKCAFCGEKIDGVWD